MANVSQIKIVTRVLTSEDILSDVVAIRVNWDSPFSDTNYVVSWTFDIEPFTLGVTQPFQGAMLDISPSGFTAAVNGANAGTVAGQVLTIYAMGCHR